MPTAEDPKAGGIQDGSDISDQAHLSLTNPM